MFPVDILYSSLHTSLNYEYWLQKHKNQYILLNINFLLRLAISKNTHFKGFAFKLFEDEKKPLNNSIGREKKNTKEFLLMEKVFSYKKLSKGMFYHTNIQ